MKVEEEEERERERGVRVRVRWGTWEELILGGAVLRHGTHDWNVIAKEVQNRTSFFPSTFSPQVCKAKYEALQEQYSGCSAWFDELRKKRVEELRRALDMSEDSIGSLETKLVSLKAEKGMFNTASYNSSLASPPVLLFQTGCNESSCKDASKDGSSAGSYTHEAQAGVVLERFPSIDELAETMRSEHGVSIKGRRGKRKRKNPSDGKSTKNSVVDSIEGSTGSKKRKKQVMMKDVKEERVEEEGLVVTISPSKKKVEATNCVSPSVSKKNEADDDFGMILESIMENEHASVFRRRLDSQKRARYRSIVRRHMDLDTIRSRIANKSIKSVVELLRDLLLIANNALVFYSRMTREYRCALVLRDIVTKRLLHQYYYKGVGDTIVPTTQTPKCPVHKPPAKPRSARPFNRKPGNNVVVVVPKDVSVSGSGYVGSPSSAESSALTQKSPGGRRGKNGRVKRGNTGIQAETPMRVRKKAKDKVEKLVGL